MSKEIKIVDLCYQNCSDRLVVFEKSAKTRVLNRPFFIVYLGSQKLCSQVSLKVLKTRETSAVALSVLNNAKNRTKISLEAKFQPKFGPSDSFLFRSLSLYLFPPSYSEVDLKPVQVSKLVRLASS